jgi:hypothetical protein
MIFPTSVGVSYRLLPLGCGIGFAQFLGALIAAHIDGFPADLDCDEVVVEFIVTGGTGSLCHGFLQIARHEHLEITTTALPPLSESLAI